MNGEPVYIGSDVAQESLEVAVSDSQQTIRFTNDYEGIAQAVEYFT